MASRARNPSHWAGNHEFLITRVEPSGRGSTRAASKLSRLLQSFRRHWKELYCSPDHSFCPVVAKAKGTKGGSVHRFVSKDGATRGGGSRTAFFAQTRRDACPIAYPKQSIKEISKGRMPYLLGGKPPGCKQCQAKEYISEFCQYGMVGHGQCDDGQRYYLTQLWLDREFHSILQFTPCDLWPLLKGRTLYFSGDSQTQDFMIAAHCFMYEFTDLGWRALDAQGKTDGPKKEGFVWHTDPGCVLLPEDTRICFIRCDEFECVKKEVVERLAKASEKRDLLVLNFGLHFSEAYEEELKLLVQQDGHSAGATAERDGDFPFLLWKDTAPQHFESTYGEYPQDKPKPPMKCVPIGKNFPPNEGADKWVLKNDHTVEVLDDEFKTIAEGGWRNKITNDVMSKAGIPVVSTWNETLPLWDFHRDNGHGLECTHFCAPSAPQLWLYLLYETLAELAKEKRIETF